MIKLQTNGDIIMSTGDDINFTFYLTSGEVINPVRHIFKPNQGECLYFLILQPNYIIGDPILIKTIKDNGDIITEKKGGTPTTSPGHSNMDEDGNMIISLAGTDTSDLMESPYKYQIKAKINNFEPLNSKPTDWDTDCTKYYYWNPSTGLYVNVAAGTAWNTQTVYYNKNVQVNTVTNRHNLWLINDDYNRVWD